MPSPIYPPLGPWGFDSSGAATPMYFSSAPFFTFGPYPNSASIPNTITGATDIPFVPLIFDYSNSTWADSMLSTAQLVSGIHSTKAMFGEYI